METKEKTVITVQATILAPVEKVWKLWTTPEDIVKWNQASDDWHTTHAENDLQPGGRFTSRMEAKDGSMGFDFFGDYDKVIPHKLIEYTLGDNRKVKVIFIAFDNKTEIVESFEAEDVNSIELQHKGWQAIMDSFKRYAEAG
jgi:uncharacterized protein YndB with AHSA1/START domain